MKKIIIILLSIISQIGSAQEYKKIDYSKLIYKRNGLFSKNSIIITNKDNSKLAEGFYEMTIKNDPDQFYISSKGNVDGVFKEYNSNRLFCKTVLKEGKLQNMVYLDSIGKTIDSLQIRNKDIEIYNNILKKWETKPLLVYASYSFNDNGKVYKETFGGNGDDIKKCLYYDDGTKMMDETYFYYRKKFDSLGVLEEQVDYNWQTKETQTLSYKNGKLQIKKIAFDEDENWNKNGTITRNTKKHPSNHINKSYTIITEYYPSGKIYRFAPKTGESKEYTEDGVEIIYTQMVKMAEEEEPPVYEDSENTIYKLAEMEIKPEYPNGIVAFYIFFYENFIMPKEEELKGKIQLSFVVEKDGSLSDIKVIRDIGYGTGLEAIRVLGKSKKWISGELNGKKIRCFYNMFISLPSELK
jgi:hypothetical protein